MPKILIKPGVEFNEIAPAGVRILEVLKQIQLLFPKLPYDIVITSGTDGTHSGGPTNPHYQGEAYDIRTNVLTLSQKTTLLNFVKEALGPRFFAFLENPGKPAEHIHIQRARNTFYTM